MKTTKYLNLITVTCAVPRVYLGDCEKNADAIIDMCRDSDSAVILFPELSLTGYTCGDLFFQETLLTQAKDALARIVAYSSESPALIAVGLPVSIDSRLYNCAALIQRGRLLGLVPKTFVPDNREFYEKRWFSDARTLKVQSITLCGQDVPCGADLLFVDQDDPELIVAAEICEDLWAPLPPSTALAAAGATIVLNPSASNDLIAKAAYRRALVAQQSARLNCAYLYVSCGYGESTQDAVFGGDAIIAEKGTVLAQKTRFELKNSALTAQIDSQALIHDRRMQASAKDTVPEGTFRRIPVTLVRADTLTRTYEKNPFVPCNPAERDERCEEILNIQSMGLGTRVAHIGGVPMVIGVSGGLDSTLALLVCRQVCYTFGWDPKNIIAVTMPGFGTTDRTYENAVKLIHDLGATFKEIPIRDAARAHLKDIGHPESVKNEVYENAQARERTQILMDIANQVGGIVVGTGDLSELALGWATYNGDHMSMYGVNAGVPKTLVRYLVRYYADHSGPALKKLLYDILDTPVSPELLPPDKNGEIAQKTEEKIGPYELNDFFLYHLVRNGFSPAKIYALAVEVFKDEYTPEYIYKWLNVFIRRFFSQQFKRSCLPDGPKVGSVTLSPRADWRMPSDISSRAWLKELEALAPEGHE